MGRRLYVGNLPYTTGEAELQELFSKAGTVESVRVMRDAATGRARGFAFVEMATDEEAQKAATEFNQFQMGGRALTVNEARRSRKVSAAAAVDSAATVAAAAVAVAARPPRAAVVTQYEIVGPKAIASRSPPTGRARWSKSTSTTR